MMYLFDKLFPNKYLLTLKENTNRQKHFRRELDLAEIENVNIVYSKKVLLRKCFKNPASRSITLTHLKIHRMGLKRPNDNLLVLEDDIQFIEGFKSKIEPVLRELQSHDWDLFYFFKPVKGNSDLSGKRGEIIHKYHSGLMRITGTINSHAYAINKSSLPNLVKTYNLDYINKLHPQIRIIDKSMPNLPLKIFAVDQDFIFQCEDFESATKNVKQFSGFFDNVVQYVRPKGNQIINK